MKRLHIHTHVADLEKSVAFYTGLFGAPPTVERPDYAKWLMESPDVNFAISSWGTPGISHLGFQVDDDETLTAYRERLVEAGAPLADQKDAACCYAKSDKVWAEDPEGVSWEIFKTDRLIDVAGDDVLPPNLERQPAA
jgi:catechol 2,3-dioxygenase-like lactoylglutathione lyase family enzyme